MHPLVVNVKSVNKFTSYVYCGRGSNVMGFDLGNLWSHLNIPNKARYKTATREEAVSKHREYFILKYELDPLFRKAINSLKGKTLSCYCAPLLCHAEVIAEYANKD